jgi:ribosomal protein S12 methylthiotransferase accessory factor
VTTETITTDTTESALARLGALVSPDVGVIHRVDAGVTQYDHPRLAPTYAQVCDTGALFAASTAAHAGGMAEDPQRSWLAAAGEAVERYSATVVPRSRLRRARADELTGVRTVAPLWLAGQRRQGPINWVLGARLRPDAAAQPAWVAASRVYLAHDDSAGTVATPTSSGLACHADPWQALYSALTEVIERDAVMITWLTRSRPTPLPTALHWTARDGNAVRFDRAPEKYLLYQLDSPAGIPVVFAVARGAEGQPGAAVGAAAHLSLAHACRKALVEAHQTMQWASHMLAEGRARPPSAQHISDLEGHVAYYLAPSRARAFDFLDGPGPTPRSVDLAKLPAQPDPETACRELVARLAAAGLDCYAVDVTAPEVRAAGLWVVRAVVPGLYPLLVGTGVRPEHPRLAADAPVNPDPHPFP